MQPDEVQNLSEEGYSVPGILMLAAAICVFSGQIWIGVGLAASGVLFLGGLKLETIIPEQPLETDDDLDEEM